MQNIPHKQESIQKCWESDTFVFLAHYQSMPLPCYLGQEGQARSSSFPHPQVWDLREERRAAKLHSSVLCLPQATCPERARFSPCTELQRITELPSYRPDAETHHTHCLSCYSSAWKLAHECNSWAADELVQVLSEAMRSYLHIWYRPERNNSVEAKSAGGYNNSLIKICDF